MNMAILTRPQKRQDFNPTTAGDRQESEQLKGYGSKQDIYVERMIETNKTQSYQDCALTN